MVTSGVISARRMTLAERVCWIDKLIMVNQGTIGI